MVDWLSEQNHKEDKDVEILARKVNIDEIHTTTGIPNVWLYKNYSGWWPKMTTYNN